MLLKLDLCVEILQKLFSEVLYTMCATGDFQRENCSSLHLTQEFSRLYPGARNVPILSRESAPGIIMATGIIGQNLKDRPDVYVSSSAGYQWRPVSSLILRVWEMSQYCRIIIIYLFVAWCSIFMYFGWLHVCVWGRGEGGSCYPSYMN